VLESSETSNHGSTINSNSTNFSLGDDASNSQYQKILFFDVSALLDNAWIVSAVLKIKKSGQVGSDDPFGTHQKLTLDIRKPYFGTAVSLAAADFQASASLNSVGYFSSMPSGGWYSANPSSSAFQWFKLTGSTQLRLRFQLDDNGDHMADDLKFYNGNASTLTDRPVLEIQYLVP